MKKFRMPPGFRFSPTDQELLYYLKMKAKGMSFQPWNDVVLEKNLYSENAAPWMLFNDDDPWQVTSKVDAATGKIYEEKILYIVTKLVKIGSNKTVRSVGSWTWDGATGRNKIWNNQGQVMGFKKMLNLRGKGMEVMGNWIMHEYHLSGVSLQDVEDNDYVICRIKWDYSRNIRCADQEEVQESGGLRKLGKKRRRIDQEIPDGKRVCDGGSNSSVLTDDGVLIAESEAYCGESDECGILIKEKSRFDQESSIRERVCSSGRGTVVVNEGELIAERSLFLETEVQESEAHNEGSDECQILPKEKSVFGQESAIRKMVCKTGSNSILVIDEGNVMGEVPLILETEVPENNVELEILSMERSRFNQESSIGTGVSDSSNSSSSSISFNGNGANFVALDCSCGRIQNSGGESDIMQQVLEDNFYIDLGDIIELDLTLSERVF